MAVNLSLPLFAKSAGFAQCLDNLLPVRTCVAAQVLSDTNKLTYIVKILYVFILSCFFSSSFLFSSGLWPFATVGWPHVEGKDASAALVEQYKLFYPATVMETGYDILFFWVARMVMLGLQLTDRAPFETVYLHGLVRDAEGQKMSKTKGNVIDPIDTIERVGCDSLRYSLVTGSTPGQDIPLSMERIDANRNFMNKLWNMGKYVQNSLSQLSEAELLELKVLEPMSSHELASLPLPERAIVHNLHQLVIKMTHCLETFALGEAGQLAYEFLWDELADWYVEISKTRMRDPVSARQARRVLSYVWDTSLRLLHPYAPFLTETLWQQLPQTVDSIMIADWPLLRVDDSVEAIIASDTEAAEIFQQMQRLVRGIRNVRAEYKTEQGRKLPAAIRVSVSTAAGARLLATLQQETASLSLLGRMDDTSVHFIPVAGALTETSFSAPTGFGQCVQVVIDEGLEVYIPLSGMIDREKELSRLGKQVEKLNKDIATLQARLSSDGFVGRAPESVVLEVKSNLREKQEQLLVVEKSLVDIQSS